MNNSKKSWGKPSKAMVQLMLAAVMLVALIATAIPTMAQPPPASPEWYWKEPYPNYAPSGMPDFSQRQDNWVNPDTGALSFCGPTALANCLWWFDSKYGNDTGVPGDANDIFPLVRDYTDQLPPVPGPNWDDHNFNNVNDLATAWPPPGPPPALPPFVPGLQPQPQPIEPWGELIERLAWNMDCDGIRTGAPHMGTYVADMEAAIDQWLAEEGLDGLFSETTVPKPDFYFIEEEVERSEDVILLLGFWVWVEDEAGVWVWQRIGGHYVTVAGVNSDELMIAFSDPFLDQILAPSPTEHNDAAIVSHDIWHVALDSSSPGGTWWIPDYGTMDGIGGFYAQNLPEEFEKLQAGRNVLAESGIMTTVHTEVEYAVIISPLPDLVITEKWLDWPQSCTIYYEVKNIGAGTAAAGHGTTLYVDDVEVAHDPVGVPLAPGASHTGYFKDYNWTYTPPSDKIEVCADNYNVIPESDELNNCLTNIWKCGDVNCSGGEPDMADVLLLWYFVGYPGQYTLCNDWAGDVNCSGEIDMGDVLLLWYFVGYPGQYELNCCCEIAD